MQGTLDCCFVLFFYCESVNIGLVLQKRGGSGFVMQKEDEIRCPYCKKKNRVMKYGYTEKRIQRYRCGCGKSFIIPVVEEKKPNCPECKNNTHVIKWGEIKDENRSPRYKQQRYFCKIHKMSFSKTLKIFDEKKIIKAYLSYGDDGLKEFLFDESGFNRKKFIACMDIIREYERMSAERYIIYGDLESIYEE